MNVNQVIMAVGFDIPAITILLIALKFARSQVHVLICALLAVPFMALQCLLVLFAEKWGNTAPAILYRYYIAGNVMVLLMYLAVGMRRRPWIDADDQ